MTPFTLPALLDLSVIPLQLTPGTYTDLVNDLWNGQDPDTDPQLNASDDAAALLDSAGDDPMGATDAAVALSTVRNAVPTNPGAQNAADLAPAIAAAGGHLNDYETISAPSINPTAPTPPTSNPPTGTPPGTSQACPTDPSETNLGTMTVGDAPQSFYIDADDANPGVFIRSVSVNCGDPDIFSIKKTNILATGGVVGPPGDYYEYDLIINAAKPGTFNAVVVEAFKGGGSSTISYYFTVTINAPAFSKHTV